MSATMTKRKSKTTWREDDPQGKTVGELGPEDLYCRIVIRSGDIAGTIYGTLVGVRAHPTIVGMSLVHIYHKKEFAVRDDREALVLDF